MKKCIKISCSLRNLEVKTDREKCLSCNEKLSPTLSTSDIFNSLFGNPFNE